MFVCDDDQCGRVSTFVVEHGVMMKMQRTPHSRDKNPSAWNIRTAKWLLTNVKNKVMQITNIWDKIPEREKLKRNEERDVCMPSEEANNSCRRSGENHKAVKFSEISRQHRDDFLFASVPVTAAASCWYRLNRDWCCFHVFNKVVFLMYFLFFLAPSVTHVSHAVR